jgi:IS30 family transposase
LIVFARDDMVDYVIGRLQAGWTPMMIAGRIHAGFPGCPTRTVSHETIYQWIYSPKQRHRGLAQYLVRGHTRRRNKHQRRVRSWGIPFRVSIHHRPDQINNRSEFGHWEGDTVLGVTTVGDGIHTAVERLSRLLRAQKIPAVTSQATHAAQMAIFTPMPAHAARSVTLDNGTENHLHYRLDELAMTTYFTDPYCSWQKGTIEHFNGRLRRYLPKGTDFTTITQTDLDHIINDINNQPLQILSWATPAEVFHQLCSTPDVTVALQN